MCNESSRVLPWDRLPRPNAEGLFSSVKVDPLFRWGAYWAIDVHGHYGFLIHFDEDVELSRRLPKLREMSVGPRIDDSGKKHLVFVLLQPSLRRVFHEFCQGLVHDLESAQDQEDVARRAAEYTWSWYRFLRGHRAELSDEEQRGLVGEIIFLRDHLAPRVGWPQAVSAWSGPLGLPKDFSWQDVAVEVKTHMISARPQLKISSEFQLEVEGFAAVWLFVLAFQKGDVSTSGGVTVADVICDTKKLIGQQAPEAVDEFESRVLAYGYRTEHDYSDGQWLLGPKKVFAVTADFPAVRSADLALGISQTKYLLSMSAIDGFEVSVDRIFDPNVSSDGR